MEALVEKRTLPPDIAEYLFNHCFLPAKLPQAYDNELGAAALLRILAGSGGRYGQSLDEEEQKIWNPIFYGIQITGSLYANDGSMCEDDIFFAIKRLQVDCEH